MSVSNQGFNYILFAICEILNYVIGIPIQKANAVTSWVPLQKGVIYQIGPSKALLIDEDSNLSADTLMHI